jgi:hypothetical protein
MPGNEDRRQSNDLTANRPVKTDGEDDFDASHAFDGSVTDVPPRVRRALD